MSGLSLTYSDKGIPVITVSSQESQNSAFMVAVNTGSRDETPDIFGLSHLLEHVVFRATKTKNSFQMSKEIEEAGGYLNAFTGKEMTAFHAISIKDTADVAKNIVADIVRNPLINENDVELEKKIVLQEISMVENNPNIYIHDLFDEVVWKGHELEQGEAGNKKVVSSLTNKELRKYYEDRYGAQNMAVIASGHVTQDEVKEWTENNFDDMVAKIKTVRKAPDVCNHTYKLFKRKDDHCYAGMGFSSFGPNDKDMTAMRILSTVLGGGSASRLFQSVREEKALVYDIHNYVNRYTDASSMATFMSATENNVLEAIMTAAETFRKLKDEGLVKDEIQRAKNIFRGSLTRGLESTSNKMEVFAIDFMKTGKVKSVEDRMAEIDAVTEEDVMRVAERILDPKKVNLAMYSDDVKSMKDFSIDQLDF